MRAMTSQVIDPPRLLGQHGGLSTKECVMSLISVLGSPTVLRRVLWADAASGAATGALQLAVPGVLSAWLGLPAAWITASGALIFAFVALAVYLTTRAAVPRSGLWLLVLGNAAWVVGCLELAFAGPATLTAWGQAYLLVQAVAVAMLAELQWMGLRRASRSVELGLS